MKMSVNFGVWHYNLTSKEIAAFKSLESDNFIIACNMDKSDLVVVINVDSHRGSIKTAFIYQYVC